MKALIVKTFCVQNAMDMMHGGGSLVDGVYIEGENLLIQRSGKKTCVQEIIWRELVAESEKSNFPTPQIIREVVISEAVVSLVKIFITAKNAFSGAVQQLWQEHRL